MLSVTTSLNQVHVYNVTPGKALPGFLTKGERRRLAADSEYKKRIDVVQGLAFPTLSCVARFSPDLSYLAVAGSYPPMFKMYDLTQSSMKFQRNTTAEIVDLHFLSEDYKKLILVEADRYLEIHAQQGRIYKVRVPKAPRCSCFDPHVPQVLVSGSGPEIYRLDLQEGRFRTSWPAAGYAHAESSGSFRAIEEFGTNALCYSEQTCLTFSADRYGVGVYDARAKGGLVSSLFLGEEITALALEPSGLRLAAGSAESDVLLYDLRSSAPLARFTHHSDLPINTLQFHESHGVRRLLSCDSRSIRAWDLDQGRRDAGSAVASVSAGTQPSGPFVAGVSRQGSLFCAIEGESAFRSFVVYPGSGLIFAPSEQENVPCYYVPQLGPAPRFAAHLDQLAEDLDANAQVGQYEDFKFVTLEELRQCGLEAVSSSSLVQPYMHGYYISRKLWDRAVLANKLGRGEIKEAPGKREKQEQRQAEKIGTSRANRAAGRRARDGEIGEAVGLVQQLAGEVAAPEGPGAAEGDDRFAELFR